MWFGGKVQCLWSEDITIGRVWAGESECCSLPNGHWLILSVVHSSNCELWSSARPIFGLNLGVTYAVDRRHGPNLINPQWPTIVAIKCYKNQIWLPLWVVYDQPRKQQLLQKPWSIDIPNYDWYWTLQSFPISPYHIDGSPGPGFGWFGTCAMNRRRLPQDSDDTGSWRKLHFRLRGGHGGLVEAGTSRSAVQIQRGSSSSSSTKAWVMLRHPQLGVLVSRDGEDCSARWLNDAVTNCVLFFSPSGTIWTMKLSKTLHVFWMCHICL